MSSVGSTLEPFLLEIEGLGFKEKDTPWKSQAQTIFVRESEEIEITLTLVHASTIPHFYLGYANDFIQITTRELYLVDILSVVSVLNPFLYNITRLKGVEASND